MPKKHVTTITIEDYLPYKKDTPYSGVVANARIQPKRNLLTVVIRHDDSEQQGRLFETTLPLPARPDNPTCNFLKSCRIENLQPGSQIQIEKLIGVRVLMRFLSIEESGDPDMIIFENLATLTHKKKKDPAHEVLPPPKTKYSSKKTEPTRMAKP